MAEPKSRATLSEIEQTINSLDKMGTDDSVCFNKQQINSLNKSLFDILQFDSNLDTLKKSLLDCSEIALSLNSQLVSIDNYQSDIQSNMDKIENLLFVEETMAEIGHCFRTQSFCRAGELLYRLLHSNDSALYEEIEPENYRTAKDFEKRLQTEYTNNAYDLLLKQKFDKLQNLVKPLFLANMPSTALSVQVKVLAKTFSSHLSNTIDFEEHSQNPEIHPIQTIRIVFDSATAFLHSSKQTLVDIFGQNDSVALLAHSVIFECLAHFDAIFSVYWIRCRGENWVEKIEKSSADLNLIQIDKVLNELCLFCQEMAFFKQSLSGVFRLRNLEELLVESEFWPEKLNCFGFLKSFKGKTVFGLLDQKFHEIVQRYIFFESVYVTNSAQKALFGCESLNGVVYNGLTKEAVEDTFYILKKVILRAYSTADINAICAIFNNIHTFLEKHIFKKIQKMWANVLVLLNPEFFVEKRDINSDEKMSRFFGNVKNLAIFSEHFNLLVGAIIQKNEKMKEEFGQKEIEQLKILSQDFEESFREIERLENKCVGFIGKMIFSMNSAPLNSFMGQNFDIESDGTSEPDENDDFCAELIHSMSYSFEKFEQKLPPKMLFAIVENVSNLLAEEIETQIFTKKFTIWGGIQFDNQILSLISFLSKLSDQGIRHTFKRLIQISSLLQFEKVSELEDYKRYSKSVWTLQDEEITNVFSLRTDL